MKISGNLVDIHKREIYPAEIISEDGTIKRITRVSEEKGNYILPGFIDAHVHIESSMVTPGAFAVTAVKHGTIGTVSDPHEIANVLGINGVDFMIRDGEKVPFYFWFGAPSCVPATSFESSGAELGSDAVGQLLSRADIKYLSEMMNYPGVIYDNLMVHAKIEAAKKYGKKVDGHAPGLKGKDLEKYVKSGISTDHECSSLEEAEEKISLGMKVLIREGSAARNMEALKGLIKKYPEMVMLCSDDIHPEMLKKRHINKIAASLIREGFNAFDVIRACSLNPVDHYGLEAGLLREGDRADFIVTSDLNEMEIAETWIKGVKVWDGRDTLFTYTGAEKANKFNCSPVSERSIAVINRNSPYRVIRAFDGELLTEEMVLPPQAGEFINSDPERDILKIVVKNRYTDSQPAVGFISGFGLRQGAFASSVAHDSHNIICIGTSDKDIVDCINEIVRTKGGLAVASSGRISSLELGIAGIMSDSSVGEVARSYQELSEKVKLMGCGMSSPFMTLSFMALLVIPALKIGDKGLFDSKIFSLTTLFRD